MPFWARLRPACALGTSAKGGAWKKGAAGAQSPVLISGRTGGLAQALDVGAQHGGGDRTSNKNDGKCGQTFQGRGGIEHGASLF